MLPSCGYNIFSVYCRSNYLRKIYVLFMCRKTYRLHSNLKIENLGFLLKISNVHVDLFFSFNLNFTSALQRDTGEGLTVRRIIRLVLIYLCTFSKLLCLESSKTDVFNKQNVVLSGFVGPGYHLSDIFLYLYVCCFVVLLCV